MPGDLAAAREPEGEHVGEHGIAAGQRQQAVADVAGRGEMVGRAELAGAAAVVRDGGDRGQPRLVALEIPGVRFEEARTEAAEHGGQARAAAEGHDAQVEKGSVSRQARAGLLVGGPGDGRCSHGSELLRGGRSDRFTEIPRERLTHDRILGVGVH